MYLMAMRISLWLWFSLGWDLTMVPARRKKLGWGEVGGLVSTPYLSPLSGWR